LKGRSSQETLLVFIRPHQYRYCDKERAGHTKCGMAERVGIRSRIRRGCSCSYRGGQPPRRHPVKGTDPLQNPCSNPTLSLLFGIAAGVSGVALSSQPSWLLLWRRGWDSNPRSSYPDSSFRDCPIRPLSHLSVCRLCLKLRQDGVTQWLQRVDLGRAYRGEAEFSNGFLSACRPLR
jgi:hypothetical protein